MMRISKLGLCSAVVSVLPLTASRAQAQATMNTDSTNVKRGSSLFVSKGCNVCHNISHTGKMSGPDLRGVVQNRDRDWLVRFLKNTDEMLTYDAFAIAMLKKWDNVKMPNVKLTDSEIEALINYLGEQRLASKD